MSDTSVDGDRLLDEPSYFVEHYIGVEPFDYQQEFMDYDSNRKAFVSGRRVGKSRTASWMALHSAATNHNHQVLITAPSQRQSTELFNQVKKEIRQSGIPEEAWGIERATRTEINFKTGSRIKVVPLGNDGSNVRGFGADMLIVDEAAHVDGNIFREVLAPMLAFGDGDFILLSTPLGKRGYLWQQWEKILGRRSNDEGWYGKQVPTSANPGISDDFIERQKRDLSTSQFKREYLGQFDSAADAFFDPDDLIDSDVAVERAITKETDSCYLGVDLASTGGDRSVYVSVDANGNVFSVEYTEDTPLPKSTGRVKELHAFNNYTKILVDETGLGEGVPARLQEDLGRRTVEGFKFSSNKKKQSLFNTLKSQIQDKKIRYTYVPNADEPENMMVSELMDLGYSYTRTGKMRIEHPNSGHDDFCLSDDTEILTASGWKGIDEMTENDVVAAYDGDNIVYESPLRVIRKDFDGEMLNFVGDDFDALVTPNHKMVFERKTKSDGEDVWVSGEAKAKELLEISERTLYGNRMFPVASSQSTEGVGRKDWELALMGWMITEGWESKSGQWDIRRYMLGQSKENGVDTIEKLVSRFEPAQYNREDGCVYWQFHKQDNEYFDNLLPDGLHRIPRTVLTRADVDQLETLYDAMMSGDGTVSRNTYHTSSKELARDFQELCHKLGKKANVVRRKEDTNFKDGYIGYDVYVHENEKHRDKARVSSIEKVPYDGRVWCVTVPSGKLVTRRNGTIMVVGNCDALALAVWAKEQKQVARSDSSTMKPFSMGSLRGGVR